MTVQRGIVNLEAAIEVITLLFMIWKTKVITKNI